MAPRPVSADWPVPWWDMAQRLRWTVDLFERLENRQRVRP
jgi:hypothetical protein